MKLLTMLMLCSVPFSANAREKSLCQADERAWFSCETQSGKLISFCGSPDLKAKKAYVQYRFGRRGAVELEWPARQSLRRDRLRLNGSLRGPCDDIFFIRGKHRYDVLICLKSEVVGSKRTGRKVAGPAGVVVGRCKQNVARTRPLTRQEVRNHGTRKCLHRETKQIAEIACKKYPGFGFDSALRDFVARNQR